jgi:hypothetical protein
VSPREGVERLAAKMGGVEMSNFGVLAERILAVIFSYIG